MAWAIAIICVTLSCEPVPVVSGWFEFEDECISAAVLITSSWKPEIGFYTVKCFARPII